MAQIPGAVDVHVQQMFCTADDLSERRPHARAIRGLERRRRGQSVLLTLSSSFQINPSFWVNPQNGVNTTLPCRCHSTRSTRCSRSRIFPISSPDARAPQVLGNLADCERERRAGACSALRRAADDRMSMPRCEGRDLGGVDTDIQKDLAGISTEASARHRRSIARAGRDHDFILRRAGRGRGLSPSFWSIC